MFYTGVIVANAVFLVIMAVLVGNTVLQAVGLH